MRPGDPCPTFPGLHPPLSWAACFPSLEEAWWWTQPDGDPSSTLAAGGMGRGQGRGGWW